MIWQIILIELGVITLGTALGVGIVIAIVERFNKD